MSRFVRPDVTKLKISGGDTLVVKRRLNAGEQRAAFARMATAAADGSLHVNRLQVGHAMVLAYLVDWSLTDDSGKVVEIRDRPIEAIEAALNALDSESYTEIKTAIEDHDAAIREAREQEKNGPDGANESSAISPSPVSVTGDMSGSAS